MRARAGGTSKTVAALALAGLALTACQLPASPVSRSTPSPPASSPSATDESPAAGGSASRPGPPGGPVPKGFQPQSYTFVSRADGWVLGTAPCASPPCTSIVRTRDGGSSWVGIPAPRATLAAGQASFSADSVTGIRFANQLDGWAFGPGLHATHDGGAHWTAQTLPGAVVRGFVMSLEATAGRVHAAVLVSDLPSGARIEIVSSPVDADRWQTSATSIDIGAGPVAAAQVVLQGSSGWVIENDRQVIGGARLQNGQWVPWQPPCMSGGGTATLAAASATSVIAVCDEGLWNGQTEVVNAYTSKDGGSTFVRTPTPVPLRGAVEAANPVTGTIFVGGSTADQQDEVLGSFDGGKSWPVRYRSPAGTQLRQIGFVAPEQGAAVIAADARAVGTALVMTFDGGRSWRPVVF